MFLNFYSGPFLRGYMKMFQRKQTLLRTVLKRYFNVLLNKKNPMHLSLLEKKLWRNEFSKNPCNLDVRTLK